MEKWITDGYVCHPQQVYTLRRMVLAEGKAKGVNVIEVCTAGGLQVDILPDSGLDIGQVRYQGTNMAFISKNGYDTPSLFIPYEGEFGHTFSGGMLYTCGLRSTGINCWDGNEYHPSHGRYHGLSADHISTDVEDGYIVIKGVVRETAIFGHVLEVKRTIRIPIMGAEITVNDVISNLTPQDEEYALLYHCNFGYPMISEKAKLILPEQRRTSPRTEYAATGLGKECTFEAPIPGDPERVFFHEDMERKASVENPELGVRMNLTWTDTLPILAHWRSMASGDYVLGLEPTNCYIMGRKDERENGTLPVLGAFQSVETGVTISFEKI